MRVVDPLISVTAIEYVSIVATVQGAYDDKWNCHACLTSYDARNMKDKNKLLNSKREIKGCWGKDRPYTVEDIEYYTCIGNYNSANSRRYIDMFDHFEKGIMPFNGAYMDQPCKVIDIFNIIKSIRNKIIDEQRRAQQIEDKRNRARKL